MRPTTILHVALNTGDVVEQLGSVVFPETTKVVRPLVAALLPASAGIEKLTRWLRGCGKSATGWRIANDETD